MFAPPARLPSYGRPSAAIIRSRLPGLPPARETPASTPVARKGTTVSRLFVALLVLALLGRPLAGSAEAPAASEYLLKAAFLYNFAKFVEWPAEALPDAAPSLRLCILGADPFGEALQSIRGKSVKGKELTVEHLASPAQLSRCQMLFVSESEKPRLPQILGMAGDCHTLTIGEMAGFSQTGGMINFVTVQNRVRLEINPDAARRAGLRISSKLLSLATLVDDKR